MHCISTSYEILFFQGCQTQESQLRGIRMSSPDIRAGVSLLIAALSSRNESIISNISQIDRGYQNIDGRLNALGAQIERIEE